MLATLDSPGTSDIEQLPYEESLTLECYCVNRDKETPESASTLLDTIETSGEFSRSVSWRQASGRFDDPVCDRIQSAYAQLDKLDGTNRESQLLDCHTLAYFARHEETGEVKVISRKCGLRWCPSCQNAKRGWITHEVSEWLRLFKHPKILTLTLLHSDELLSTQIDRLYKCFQNLRKRKFFKSKVTGGVWFFQIKKSKNDGLWHPHLHCLITGLFLPRDKLSKLWLKITGDSPVCDIRAVQDPDTAVRHVARYAAAPCDLTNLSQSEIADIIQAMHGRRIVGTWGLAKSISLKPNMTSDSGSWVNIGFWKTVYDARGIDDNARRIFECWNLSLALEPGVTMFHNDELIADGLEASTRPPPDPYLTNFYN